MVPTYSASLPKSNSHIVKYWVELKKKTKKKLQNKQNLSQCQNVTVVIAPI